MTLEDAEKYFMARIAELERISGHGNPWVFLCGTALIEYLSKLAEGTNCGGGGFKRFVRTYMPAGYKTFQYKSGIQVLPEQLYHVLRCGIVHSYSLIPDQQAKDKGGRDRSIVLDHEAKHISPFSSQNVKDACCLNAWDFVRDIEGACRDLFAKAKTDTALSANISGWLQSHPPIMSPI